MNIGMALRRLPALVPLKIPGLVFSPDLVVPDLMPRAMLLF